MDTSCFSYVMGYSDDSTGLKYQIITNVPLHVPATTLTMFDSQGFV